jgi:hypothetical protein
MQERVAIKFIVDEEDSFMELALLERVTVGEHLMASFTEG